MRWGIRGWFALAGALSVGFACGDSVGSATTDSSSGHGTTIAPETTGPAVDSSGAATTTTGSVDESTTGTTGEPPWEGLQAGVAVRYLDRPVGVSMAGYGGRTGGTNTPWTGTFFGSRGFYSLPTIKVIALESNTGERVVLLKTPLMSSESGLTDAVVTALQDRHGLDLSGRVILTATHSHHVHGRYWRLPDIFGAVGADTSDEEVIAIMATEFADTVAAAIEDLGPAQWAYTSTEDWDPDDEVYRDRRHVNDFAYGKDPRLMMLAVRRPDGRPLATVINFAMHGTLLDTDNELLTEDAAGGLEMVFEEEFFAAHGEPIIGMFMQAGGGDAAPAGDSRGHSGIARAEVLGQSAAPTLLEQWDAMDWRDDALLDVHTRRIDLRWEYFGYDESDEFYGAPLGVPLELPYTWGGWQCTSPSAPDDNDPATSMEGEPKECLPLDVILLGDVPHAEAHQSILTTARIDELFLVTAPGEPTNSVMQYLRGQVADLSTQKNPAQVMGLGYAQDHLLYLTHPDDWFQGGYEAEMSLWGPYAARTFMDTQVSIVEQMLMGQDMPPFIEQSPTLASPGSFTPRAFEESLNAGEVIEDVAGDVMRTQIAHFRFGAGDPSLGSPRVIVQVDRGDGRFVDVPSPSGWADAALDNSRYQMVTQYDPIPGPDGTVAFARQHEWSVDWQVPADFPAGIYRLVASGPTFSAGARQQFEVESAPFAIVNADGAAAQVEQQGDTLLVRLTIPPAGTAEPTPVTPFRALDPAAGPDAPITIRAPLSARLIIDGQLQPSTFELRFDPDRGAHVIPLPMADLGDARSVSVQVHLAGDIEPDPIVGVLR